MGTLVYDSAITAEFDDRTLAHLQIVICAKLRRNESFHFSWHNDASMGEGRTVVWLHPSISLSFTFTESKPPVVSRAWIDELMIHANSPGGLLITPEPASSQPEHN